MRPSPFCARYPTLPIASHFKLTHYRIVCIVDKESGCEPNETVKKESDEISLKPEHNPWITSLLEALKENVTEDGVRQYVSQQMDCDKDQKIEISEFILFERNESKLDLDGEDHRKNHRKQRERQRVHDFADEWKKTATQWKVFGFASADGEQTGNNNLSSKRAEEVKNLLCDELNTPCNNVKAEKGMGEDHPINGVANSRSARIAVCVNGEAQESG